VARTSRGRAVKLHLARNQLRADGRTVDRDGRRQVNRLTPPIKGECASDHPFPALTPAVRWAYSGVLARAPSPDHHPRRWPLSLARLLLAGVAVGLLLLGARNAWHAHSTAAPLLVGFALLVLILAMSPDVTEFSGRYRDAEVRLVRRGRDLNLADAIRSVASREQDDGRRAELEVIADEADRSVDVPVERRSAWIERVWQSLRQAVSPADLEPATAHEEDDAVVEPSDAARTAYFKQARDSYFQHWADLGSRLPDTGAPPFPTYFFVSWRDDDGAVRRHIHVSFRWWGDWRIGCTVRSPRGEISTLTFHGSIYMQGNNFNITYPTNFPEAPLLEAGEYTFSWSRLPRPGELIVRTEREIARDVLVLTADLFAGDQERAERRAMLAGDGEHFEGNLEARRVFTGRASL
jgi:hypothetical protein